MRTMKTALIDAGITCEHQVTTLLSPGHGIQAYYCMLCAGDTCECCGEAPTQEHEFQFNGHGHIYCPTCRVNRDNLPFKERKDKNHPFYKGCHQH